MSQDSKSVDQVRVEQVRDWVRFYFDGNSGKSWIESAEAWRGFIADYARVWVFELEDTRSRLLRARRLPGRSDLFGLYREYADGFTLADFFAQHGMDTGAPPASPPPSCAVKETQP